MATINYTVNAIDAASGVFKRIAASADGLDTQLSDLSKRVATPAVDLNDAKFTVGIINAAKRLDKLNAMVANPEVEVDTAKAQLEILRINAMLDRLGKDRTTVTVDVKTDTGGLLGSLGRGAGGALGALIPGLGNTIGSLPALLGGGGSTGLAAIATSLGAIAASATAMAAVVGAALAAISFAAQAAAGVITFGLGAALAGIAILGASKAKSVKDSFADLATQANKELVTIGKPFIPVLNSLVSTTRDIMRAMTPVFTDASKIIAGPFKLFADTLVKAFGQPAVKTSIEAVATAFAKLLTALTPQIPGDVQAIANAITNIANAVAKNPKAFADFVQFLADVVKWGLNALGWLTQVAVYIEKHFIPAMSNLSGSINTFGKSSKTFTAFGFTAKAGLAGSAAAANGLADTLNIFAKAAQATTKLAGDAFTTFAKVADGETKAVVSFVAGMRHDIADIFDGIRHDTAAAWDAIWNGTVSRVKSGISDVVGWFRGMPGRLISALAGIGTAMYNEGHFILTELWNGIKSVGTSVLHWFSSFSLGLIGEVKKILGISSPSSVFYDIGRNLMLGLRNGVTDHVHQALQAARSAAGAVGSLGGPTSASAAQAQQYARSRLSAYGWSSAQMTPLIALWNQESGWNRLARNPSSGAYGIPQALPASKMGAAANPPQSSAAAQINWGLGYIKSVYGSPSAAEAHENAVHWYGSGLRNGIFTSPTIIGVGDRPGGERVNITPASQDGQRVVLEVRAGNSSAYSKFLVDELQKYIRVAGGGDVQVALGG